MTDVSEAAKLKACELAMQGAETTVLCLPTDGGVYLPAFARYIQQVSDAAKSVCRTLDLAMPTKLAADEEKKALAPFILPDPVDPLLIEAREIAFRVRMGIATDHRSMNGTVAKSIMDGRFDDHQLVQASLAALKRGMELAGGQP